MRAQIRGLQQVSVELQQAEARVRGANLGAVIDRITGITHELSELLSKWEGGESYQEDAGTGPELAATVEPATDGAIEAGNAPEEAVTSGNAEAVTPPAERNFRLPDAPTQEEQANAPQTTGVMETQPTPADLPPDQTEPAGPVPLPENPQETAPVAAGTAGPVPQPVGTPVGEAPNAPGEE